MELAIKLALLTRLSHLRRLGGLSLPGADPSVSVAVLPGAETSPSASRARRSPDSRTSSGGGKHAPSPVWVDNHDESFPPQVVKRSACTGSQRL